jgi:DhnA family fructose-bisphosphate aldolase class Ia
MTADARYRAAQGSVAGVDMGRNIFQSHAPAAMLQAVSSLFRELAHEQNAAVPA